MKYLGDTGDFWKYYIEQEIAPILTVVIGGNHESSNYFRELYFGGWLAPKIYYLGSAGVINIEKDGQNTRIAGLSGIYKPYSFSKMHPEVPIPDSDKKSCYHVREIEALKLSLLDRSEPIDIFLGHDWAGGVFKFATDQERRRQLKIKPFFKSDIDHGTFGDPTKGYLLNALNINNFFVGHCHIDFHAKIYNTAPKTNNDGTSKNKNPYVSFHAFDKCLKHRTVLEYMEFNDKNYLVKVANQNFSQKNTEKVQENTEKFQENLSQIPLDIQSMLELQKKKLEQFTIQNNIFSDIAKNSPSKDFDQLNMVPNILGTKAIEARNEPRSQVKISLDFDWLVVLKVIEKLLTTNNIPHEKLLYYDKMSESLRETDAYNKLVLFLQKTNQLQEVRNGLQQSFEEKKFDLEPPRFYRSESGNKPNPKLMLSQPILEVQLNKQTEQLLQVMGSDPTTYQGLIYSGPCNNYQNLLQGNNSKGRGYQPNPVHHKNLIKNDEEIDLGYSDSSNPGENQEKNTSNPYETFNNQTQITEATKVSEVTTEAEIQETTKIFKKEGFSNDPAKIIKVNNFEFNEAEGDSSSDDSRSEQTGKSLKSGQKESIFCCLGKRNKISKTDENEFNGMFD